MGCERAIDHAQRLCLLAGHLSVEELRRVGIITPTHDSRVRLLRGSDTLDLWSPATDATPSAVGVVSACADTLPVEKQADLAGLLGPAELRRV